MGLGDLVKSAANKVSDSVRSEMDRQAANRQIVADRRAEIMAHQAEQAKMQKIMLQINSGSQLVHASPTSTMFQRQDGTIYFNCNYNDKYWFIDYIWNGPRFETITSSATTSSGHEVTKGKAGKMIAGAAIGSFVNPVGMAVGAAVGAGGKKKKKISSQSNTNSIQRQTEILTPATLKFRNVETGNVASIVIGCNSLIDSQIKGFQIHQEQSVQEISKDTSDALKGIKALKELLDMGAITQEEFDSKKQQLLNQ